MRGRESILSVSDICEMFQEDLKKMRNKKLLSVVLTASLVFSMNSWAFADEVVEVDDTGRTAVVEEVGGADEQLGSSDLESVGEYDSYNIKVG